MTVQTAPNALPVTLPFEVIPDAHTIRAVTVGPVILGSAARIEYSGLLDRELLAQAAGVVALNGGESGTGTSSGSSEGAGGESVPDDSNGATPGGAGGEGPIDPPDGGAPPSGENPGEPEPRRTYRLENIPSIFARGDNALPERERNYTDLDPVIAQRVHYAQATTTVRTVSPKGRRITHEIEGVGSAVVHTLKGNTANFEISVDPELRDTGVGHRLAMASADELVKQKIRTATVNLGSEAGLRTVVSVYGDSLSYETEGVDGPISPMRALEAVQAGGAVYATIDVQKFLSTHYEYRLSRDPNIQVLDRVNLNDIVQTEEVVTATEIRDATNVRSGEMPTPITVGGDVAGPVRGFKERVKRLKNPAEAEHAFTVLEELLANWQSHVLEYGRNKYEGDAGNDHGFVVLYRELDPVTEQSSLWLVRYHHNVGHPNDIIDFAIVDRLDNQANPRDTKTAEASDQSGQGTARAPATEEELTRERSLDDLAERYEVEGKPEKAAAIRRAKAAAEAGRGTGMTRRYTLEQGVGRLLNDADACVGGVVFYKIRSERVDVPEPEPELPPGQELSVDDRIAAFEAAYPNDPDDDPRGQQI